MTPFILGIFLVIPSAWAQTVPSSMRLAPSIGFPASGFSPALPTAPMSLNPGGLSATPLIRPSLVTPVLSVPALALPAAPLPALRPLERGALPAVDSGDLVFLDLDCGALCDAMADTTSEQFGVAGPRLSHVGIVEVDGGTPFVWEAWPGRGVTRVPLRVFLSRVQAGEGAPGGYYLGRLRDGSRRLGEEALSRVRRLSGLPYDGAFSWESPGMYCSKLISAAFGDPSLFSPRPMYFGREGSAARETWRAYFDARGMAIPDGQPGVSPLGLYLEGSRRLFRPAPAR